MSTERLKEVAFAPDTNKGVQELDHSDIKEWADCFFGKSSRVLNPNESRLEAVNQKNDPVQFYGLVLQNIEGAKRRLLVNPLFVYGDDNIFRVTLFDMLYKQFFGVTWKGPVREATDNIHYDENLYLGASICDEHILCVVEIVEEMREKRPCGAGWTAFRPFTAATLSGDLVKRLPVYAGTPRVLFFIDDPFEKFKSLVELQGVYITYSFSEKPRLELIKKYLPENVLLGRMDRIGGIIQNPPKHCLDKPNLAAQLSVIIDDLFIYLNPNVAKFENELTQLIAEDKSAWENAKIEPSMVSISERRLKIGVHNGWRYIQEPYIVQLGVDDPTLNKSSVFHMNRRLSLKTSLRPKPSDIEQAL